MRQRDKKETKYPNKKLLESSRAVPRIKIESSDRWLRARALWKDGGKVHPGAHGHCKGPVADTGWECAERS